MDIRRQWQRLVACVNVVAFLVANTHAGTAVAAHVAPRPAHGHSAGGHDAPAHSAGHQSTRRACCHCSRHKTRATVEASQTPHEKNCPCGQSCPHCPGGPSGPKCPCPGGCALCNVAKVPHVAPAACAPCSLLCFGTRLPDRPSIYTPPFSGRLIRPPRV